MRAETRDRITGWETRPIDAGYAGVHALLEAEFSGAINAGETWLFVLDGRPVGLIGGSIETFENASPTAYVAPHPALPLLFTMRERNDEATARYYTGDTPLAETVETLSSTDFTGYIELFENVLSSEYYLVYHRGRSIEVAFVGERDRLLTEEEARRRAEEEVGIYEVTPIALEAIDVPKPEEGPYPTDPSVREDASHYEGPPAPDTANANSAVDGGSIDGTDSDRPMDDPHDTPSETTVETESSVASLESPTGSGADDSVEAPVDGEPTELEESAGQPVTPTERWGSVVESPAEERFAAERRWRETVRIPSLEPDRSTVNADLGSKTEAPSREPATPPAESRSPTEELETERRSREAVEAEADRLREEVASLRERLEELERPEGTDTANPPTADEDRVASIPPARALSETDLFVRYAAASGPTLETAHSTDSDRSAVDENLRLERHTGFDPTDVTVDGLSLEAFLEGRIEHRFADWVVRTLLFDLRETGHETALKELYDALPRIDRIEFDGSIDAGEDGLTFDVVFRNRLGEPLIVADCVDSREAVDEEEVAALVTAANAAKEDEGREELAGAMLATTSFFDPGALTTAAEATRSGLLGRNARESYVTISRRRGYHLCLIEMRDAFHLRVPEL